MEILPHFWINFFTGNNKLANEKKITNIIYLSKTEHFMKNIEIEQIRIPIDYNDKDSLEEKNNIIYQHLFDVTDYINDKINNNGKVLLLGKESCQDLDIFIIAYLIRYGKLNVNTSISFLKSKRENIFIPKCYFYYCLNKFYEEINKNKF
jgi:hypothetical protein